MEMSHSRSWAGCFYRFFLRLFFLGPGMMLIGGWSAILLGADTTPPSFWIAEVKGSINPATVEYLMTAIKQAEASRAEALIVELDTPGGLLTSVRSMAQSIDASGVPVVVFVTPAGASATSAGALLMLASHIAAMAPGTQIGAAHPVGPSGQDIEGDLRKKAVNDTAAFARGLADLRGRNRELADAVVSKSRSFTSEEALKGGLIDLLAPSRHELISGLEGRSIPLKTGVRTIRAGSPSQPPRIETLAMTPGQRLLNFLANPNIAAILLSLGMLLIYAEITHPGISLAGVFGGICLIVAFMAFQLLPVHAGGIVLLVLGIILMVAEPFVISNGALATGGILCFALGLTWIMDRSATSLRISPSVWIPLVGSLGFGIGVLAVAAARTRRLSRETWEKIGGSGLAGLVGFMGRVQKMDDSMTSGKAIFRGEIWDFESETPVQLDQEIEAIDTSGMKVRVRPRSLHSAKK